MEKIGTITFIPKHTPEEVKMAQANDAKTKIGEKTVTKNAQKLNKAKKPDADKKAKNEKKKEEPTQKEVKLEGFINKYNFMRVSTTS
jgi:hypothetical protein